MIFLNNLSTLSHTIISIPLPVVLCLSSSLSFPHSSLSSLSHTLSHLFLSSPSLYVSLSHFLVCSLSHSLSLCSIIGVACRRVTRRTSASFSRWCGRKHTGGTAVPPSTLKTLHPESLNLRPCDPKPETRDPKPRTRKP